MPLQFLDVKGFLRFVSLNIPDRKSQLQYLSDMINASIGVINRVEVDEEIKEGYKRRLIKLKQKVDNSLLQTEFASHKAVMFHSASEHHATYHDEGMALMKEYTVASKAIKGHLEEFGAIWTVNQRHLINMAARQSAEATVATIVQDRKVPSGELTVPTEATVDEHLAKNTPDGNIEPKRVLEASDSEHEDTATNRPSTSMQSGYTVFTADPYFGSARDSESYSRPSNESGSEAYYRASQSNES